MCSIIPVEGGVPGDLDLFSSGEDDGDSEIRETDSDIDSDKDKNKNKKGLCSF